jgi:BASS family bile acid:Na+ symporter
VESRVGRIWSGIGVFIGRHMVAIVLCCLAAGILLPQVFAPLRPAVPTFFAIMSFQSALGITLRGLKDAVAHPFAIVVTLLYVHVLSPVIAYLVGTALFGADPDIVVGVVLEYCVPVATSSIMWVAMYRGNLAIALATLLVSVFASPFCIPLMLHVLLGAVVEVNALGMIVDMLYMVVVPSIVGIVVNEATRGFGTRKLSVALSPLARLMLVVIIATNSSAISDYVFHLTPELAGVLVFIGLFASFNFVMGAVMAYAFRQKRDRAVSMLFQSGMRNISAGAVLAMQYFPPASLFAVMAGVLFQQVLAALFGKGANKLLSRIPS